MSKKEIEKIEFTFDREESTKPEENVIEFSYDMTETIEKHAEEETGIDEEIKEEFKEVSQHKMKKEVVYYEGSTKTTLKKSIYIGFNTRVFLYSLGIVILLIVSILSFYNIYKASKNYEIKYSEESSILYDLCDTAGTCISNEQAIDIPNANVDNMNINFIYNVDISDMIKYDVDYFIESEVLISDPLDKDIVLNRNTERLLSKNIKKTSDNISINEMININYREYVEKAISFAQKNNESIDADLTVKLYLKDQEDTTEISTYKVSLINPVLTPKTKNTNNMNKSVFVEKDAWTDTNTVLVLICIISGLIMLFLIIKLSNLLIKTFYNKDLYNKELNRILNEYDSIIVTARDGFVSEYNKKIIKVTNFEELLDARVTLKKPIVYVRINEIKSKFIVEDEEVLYEYTLKEVDL